MKTNYLLSILTVLLLTIFTSCSKENDVTPDNRTQLEGTYNYKVKYYEIAADGSLAYMGSDMDETGTLIGKKNTTDANKVDFLEGGEMAFQANKIAVASNGLSFDIPTQTITESGITYTVGGYEGVVLGTSKYHGMYDNTDKKVTAYLELDGYDMVMEFVAKKVTQ